MHFKIKLFSRGRQTDCSKSLMLSQNPGRSNFVNESSNKWTISLKEYIVLNLAPHGVTELTKHLDYIKNL